MQDLWSELRDQISEWREDTNESPTMNDDNIEQMNMPFQIRDGYITNLAVGEIKVRMRNYNPKGARREKRLVNEDWVETSDGENTYRSRTKAHARS